jgi:hypothetical protein
MALVLSKPYYKKPIKSTILARSTTVDVFPRYAIIVL